MTADRKMRIGEWLVAFGKITEEQLNEALEAQRKRGGRLGTNMVELGFMTEKELAVYLSQFLKVPAASEEEFSEISPRIISLLEPDFAESHRIIPLSEVDGKLRVAICDPMDLEGIDELSFKIGKTIEAVVAPEVWILAALERYYGIPREIRITGPIEYDEPFYGEITHVVAEDVFSDFPNTLKETAVSILNASSSAEVFRPVLGYLSKYFRCMAVYAVRDQEIRGWFLHGIPISLKEFSSFKVPRGGDSMVEHIATSSVPWFMGKMNWKRDDVILCSAFGLKKDDIVASSAVVVRGHPVAVWIGFNPPSAVGEEQIKAVRSGLVLAADALELLYLKRRISKRAGIGI